jgi:hypothetical protein
MMTNDLKSLVPAQEKLEWVTPKILQITVEETFGSLKNKVGAEEGTYGPS